MVNDPIADFLTQIRNAQQRKKDEVSVKSSKMLEAIAAILKEEGFIMDFSVNTQEIQNELNIKLKYVNGEAAIRELARVSKPGIRKYLGYKQIRPVKKGLGIAIISTPMGVVSDKKARENKVGGEYICYVY